MAKSARAEVLATTGWLQDHLDDPEIRIVEVGDNSNPNRYHEGHIPGALHWPWRESLWHETSREFVAPGAFAEMMERSGIGHETTVVLYSSTPQYANYAFWVCTMRGHTRVRILDGSRDLWIGEGRRFVQDSPSVQRTTYPVRAPNESSRIGREGVLAGLGNPDRVLLDLRSPEEYRGERVSPPYLGLDHGAQRKGRIPGAKHLHFRELLNEDNTFKTADELQAALDKRGATLDKEIVCYCRLGHRGSLGWFVAHHLLGYGRARVYDGAWTEWGSIVGYPVER